MNARQRERHERQQAWHTSRIADAGTPLERLRAACAFLLAEASRQADDPVALDDAAEVVLGQVKAWRQPPTDRTEGQAA